MFPAAEKRLECPKLLKVAANKDYRALSTSQKKHLRDLIKSCRTGRFLSASEWIFFWGGGGGSKRLLMKNSFNLQLQLSPAGDNSPKNIIVPGKRRCRKSELLKVTLGIMRSLGLETIAPPPHVSLVGGTSLTRTGERVLPGH